MKVLGSSDQQNEDSTRLHRKALQFRIPSTSPPPIKESAISHIRYSCSTDYAEYKNEQTRK